MSEPRFDVVGIDKAAVDVITSVDDASLNMHGIAKGGMTLIDVFRAKQLEDAISRTTISTAAPRQHNRTQRNFKGPRQRSRTMLGRLWKPPPPCAENGL